MSYPKMLIKVFINSLSLIVAFSAGGGGRAVIGSRVLAKFLAV
jgi:hypothetical protein